MPYDTSKTLFPSMVIAIAGGATWAALAIFADFPQFLGLWPMIRLSTVCALVGGVLAAPLFGRCGPSGVFQALVGGLLATSVGAALAVSIVEGPEAMLFGPMLVLPAVVLNPAVGGVWCLMMLAAHEAAAVTPESSGSP